MKYTVRHARNVVTVTIRAADTDLHQAFGSPQYCVPGGVNLATWRIELERNGRADLIPQFESLISAEHNRRYLDLVIDPYLKVTK